jgi:hypothetical protein
MPSTSTPANRRRLLKTERDMGWWYWLVTDIALAYGLLGGPFGFAPVIGITLVQAGHYLTRERSLRAFPVQVRLGYLGLLLLGQWLPLTFIYWIQLAGTSAMVCFDYCPLARVLSLMPWNRRQPFTLSLVIQTFFWLYPEFATHDHYLWTGHIAISDAFIRYEISMECAQEYPHPQRSSKSCQRMGPRYEIRWLCS